MWNLFGSNEMLVEYLYIFKLNERKLVFENLNGKLPVGKSLNDENKIESFNLIPAALNHIDDVRLVYGGVFLPIRLENKASIDYNRIAKNLMNCVIPSKSHRGNWAYCKSHFKEETALNPKAPSHIRGWLQNEYSRTGSWYKVRNPPGYDIDHTRNDTAFFRWQLSSMNRRSRTKEFPDKEKIRTRAQPPNFEHIDLKYKNV